MQEGNQYNNIGIHAQNVHLGNAYGATGPQQQTIDDLLRDLLMTDPSDDLGKTQRLKGKRVQGTCEWILKRDEFILWEGGDDLKLLWLIGAPGIGKTVMSCFLVEALQKKPQKMPSTILTYYFCDNKDELRSTATAILRGILLQLLNQRPALFELIREDYRLKKADIVNSLDALWRPLLRMLDKCDNEEVYILIDALDECETSSRKELLDMLGDLVGSSKAKIFITGRPESDIEATAGFIGQSLKLDSAKVNDDLSKFIDIRIDELKVKKPTFPVKLIEDIRTALRDKAGGTFLWASLVLKDISSSKTSSAARSKLNILPSDLSDIYKRILENIEHQTDHALLVLQWVVASRRPMTVCELATVQALAARDREDNHVPHADIIEEYKDGYKACGPLLYHDRRTDSVNLIHQSAKDYLLRKGCLPTRYHISQEKASLDILKTCWTYLSMQEFQQGTIIVERSETNAPLALQILTRTRSTMLCDLPNLRDLWLLSFVRLSHADGVKTLVEKGADVNVREYVEARSALYLAVEAGDIEIVRFLLDHGADVMARQEDGDTALHAAVRGGNKDMVSLLLEMGVNINEKGWYEETAFSRALASQRDDFAIFLLEKGADLEMHIDDPEHMALFEAAKTGCYRVVKFLVEREIRFKERRWGGDALSAAIEHGHTAVATFLIDQGADAAWRSEHNHKSLLYVAAEAGHEDMLKMLVEKGFDTNDSADHWVGRYRERHRFTRTALEAASAKGAVAAVEVLIEAGAEIGIRGYQGRTALHLAAKHGHDSVVSTLLRSGAGIDAHDDFGKTALHLAAEVGHDSVVTTLLRAGAGIDAHDDIGKTALHLAALSGHNSVVTTLLEAGAVINTIDHLGWTASHHAAFNRHKETVTMLIQSGSDINARTNSGETALHLVARSAQEGESLWTDEMESSDQVEDLEVAQLLLKQGANIQATNVDGINPLHLAAREGYPKITGLFLQHVVDIDATDEGGMTALHHAASYTAKPFSDYNKRTNFNLTMMLLRKGANVEIRDNAGRTPLFMAAANEDESMCRILLANGADGTAMLAVQPVDETYPKVDQVRKATERWRNINGQTARSTAEYLGQ